MKRRFDWNSNRPNLLNTSRRRVRSYTDPTRTGRRSLSERSVPRLSLEHLLGRLSHTITRSDHIASLVPALNLLGTTDLIDISTARSSIWPKNTVKKYRNKSSSCGNEATSIVTSGSIRSRASLLILQLQSISIATTTTPKATIPTVVEVQLTLQLQTFSSQSN